MRHGSLFSGIGCWGFAADKLGWETVFNCEINDFCQTVLKYYWPDAETFTDISKSDFSKYANGIDVLSGSCPCQPFSVAGKRKGSSDDRHLWPFMLAAIRIIKPVWVCYENVPGITHVENGMVFEQVSSDLENEGYETAPPLIIPACAKDAVHRRDRIWIVSYSEHNGFNGTKNRESSYKRGNNNETGANKLFKSSGSIISRDITTNPRLQRQAQYAEQAAGIEQCIADDTDTDNKGLERSKEAGNIGSSRQERNEQSGRCIESSENWLEAATRLCVLDVQSSTGLDAETFLKQTGMSFSKWRTESLKALGNTIMWEIAYVIFKAIDLLNKEPDVQESDITGDAKSSKS